MSIYLYIGQHYFANLSEIVLQKRLVVTWASSSFYDAVRVRPRRPCNSNINAILYLYSCVRFCQRLGYT